MIVTRGVHHLLIDADAHGVARQHLHDVVGRGALVQARHRGVTQLALGREGAGQAIGRDLRIEISAIDAPAGRGVRIDGNVVAGHVLEAGGKHQIFVHLDLVLTAHNCYYFPKERIESEEKCEFFSAWGCLAPTAS